MSVGLQAMAEGVAEACDESVFSERIRDYVWEPEYQPYERIVLPG
jgi:hypothetical protein